MDVRRISTLQNRLLSAFCLVLLCFSVLSHKAETEINTYRKPRMTWRALVFHLLQTVGLELSIKREGWRRCVNHDGKT